MKIEKITLLTKLNHLKQEYIEKSTAPLDGMWLCGFVPLATHFGFYENNKLVGFCCINNDSYLLQFYLSPYSLTNPIELFRFIVEQNSQIIGQINGAFVSTAEPLFLSLCLDTFTNFTVNSIMYQHELMYQNELSLTQSNQSTFTMTVASIEQLSHFVEFSIANINAPEVWVTGYYTNLIQRAELFGYWKQGQLIATGECRRFDEYQNEYADLGMIVAKQERNKGIGKKVMNYLVSLAKKSGLKPICSTEKNNISAQKAIINAGFTSSNRILKFKIN